VKWASNGAPKGDPKDMPRQDRLGDGNDWHYKKQFGEPT
jgi:hypothetical protein